MMKLKISLFKDKVLLFAILFSAIWHIFWLSAFKVVVVPKVNKSVKFSNVSFLGPILDKGAFSVGMGAHDRSASEKKYLASIEAPSALAGENISRDDYVLPPFYANIPGNDDKFISLAVSRIDTDKIEPGRDID